MTRFAHLLLVLLFVAGAAPVTAAQVAVSNGKELAQVLKAVRAGDRIVLADGFYGKLDLTLRPEGQVTVVAETPGKARFEAIMLKNSANLGFEGIEVEEVFRAQDSRGIDLRGLRTGTFYFRDVDGLHIEASEAAGGKFGLVLNSVRDFVVRNNSLHGVTEDVMRITGRSFDGLVEGNRIHETIARRPVHPDLLQFFPQKDYTPHDIVIRRNLFWDDPTTGEVPPQAIFLGDSGSTGFRNILIEENLIAVGHTNTIYINGGQENVVVRNNTLMSVKGATMPDAVIRLAAKGGKDNSGTVVHGNIVRAIHDETKKSRVVGNYVYGSADRLPQLLAGPGRGRDWRDFVPVAGSPVDFGTGFGAQDFLDTLLKAQKPKP